MIRARLTGHYREDAPYPGAMVNITNHCNLACAHCFVFRDGNPNEAPRSIRSEMDDERMLETLAALRDRHGIVSMLWMGGEPLLKRKLVERGVRLFARNVVTTNGTIPLLDLGPDVLYVVSLDGPEDLNDAIRGVGVYRRVMQNLSRLPEDFSSPVQVQCVVTRRNQHRLEELLDALRGTRVGWMTFSFYVPTAGEAAETAETAEAVGTGYTGYTGDSGGTRDGGDAWRDIEERSAAVREVMRLKELAPDFVRNSRRSLELMLPPHARRVTDACPARDHILPLYLEDDHFTTPFCCYGNDVDCSRCGAWVVFHLAARLELEARPATGTWPAL